MTFGQEAASFRLQNSDEIPDTDQRIILVALLGREPAFGTLVGQFLDPTLHLRVGTKAQQRLGALAVKTLPDSREDALQSSLRGIGWHNHKDKIAGSQVKLADGVDARRLPEYRTLGSMGMLRKLLDFCLPLPIPHSPLPHPTETV
jgi:hypothetical protein